MGTHCVNKVHYWLITFLIFKGFMLKSPINIISLFSELAFTSKSLM